MYSAPIDRNNPTCFLFLIDQSSSMLEELAGSSGKTKAEAVADSVNHLLYSLVLRCLRGDSVLPRFTVGVLGYGRTVGPAFRGNLATRDLVPIDELAQNQVRLEQRIQTNADGSTKTIRFPIWFEPLGDGGTPMAGCLEHATMILASFLVDHPDCFPPIVINITDGRPTKVNPEANSQRLRQLSSTDGNVLLFNVHISDKSQERILFPESEQLLPDPYAKLLFRMSSVLPGPLLQGVQELRPTAGPQTRGFVFNGDLNAVVAALDIGTRVSANNRK
jgi:hypothetical protein